MLIGPGVDAAPLLDIWVAGYLNLASNAGMDIDEDFVKGFVGTLFAGFVQWYISGEVAQIAMAAVTGALATLTAATAGIGIFLAGAAYLGANALINALFTFRFLSASHSLMSDVNSLSSSFWEQAGSLILQKLLSLSGIPDDIRQMFKTMFYV